MLKNHTILYVEDDPRTSEAFVNVFGESFKKVYVAQSGDEGLRLFEMHRPDLVLSDLQLPGMSGLDMIASIRERHPQLPVIVNSAFSDTEMLLRSINLHVDSYILKPTDPGKLIDALHKASRMLQLEEALHASRETIQTIIDEIPDPILYIERDYTVSMMNQAARLQRGLSEVSVVLKCHQVNYNLPAPCPNTAQPCPIDQVNRNGRPVTLRHVRRNIHNEERHVDVHMRPLFDNEGAISAYIEISHDVTDYLRIQEDLRAETQKLSHLSLHDPLTRLPNRRLLSDRIEQTIERKRRSGEGFGVYFLDLDHFKEVNDSFGHSHGDQLLVQVSQRLVEVLRKVDTIARIGGDEFVLLIENGTDEAHFAQVAEKILKKVSVPFLINGIRARIGCSIGIALYPKDGEHAEMLLSNADAAMYVSKNEGRNCYHFYKPELTQMAQEYLLLSSQIRQALESGAFELYFQPFELISDVAMACAEVLLRWNHPERGLLLPGAFLSTAAKSGLMVEIDWWVLAHTAQLHASFRNNSAKPFSLSVNLTVQTLFAPDFMLRFDQMLARYGLGGEAFVIEIVESELMQNIPLAKQRIEELHRRCVAVALDDFGTGYSSLSYLLEFDVQMIKIDQSFARSIGHSERSAKIVKSILALSKTLGVVSIAEGIETAEQRRFLEENAVDAMQGYAIDRPMPLAQWRSRQQQAYM
ncbi:MAG: EAL domain-containing protein [Campylobacterales bacterium]|nr:EAL domain-containing protein [Campylobacterales bacterium]